MFSGISSNCCDFKFNEYLVWDRVDCGTKNKNHNLEEPFQASLLLTVGWQLPRPYKIIKIKKSEYYSRLKLNGIEFGFFFRKFFLSYQQIRHTSCSLGHTIQFQRQKVNEEKIQQSLMMIGLPDRCNFELIGRFSDPNL